MYIKPEQKHFRASCEGGAAHSGATSCFPKPDNLNLAQIIPFKTQTKETREKP
jgi:hypothetical protein